MPAVLVLILCVVHASIRREGLPQAGAATVSAADIITALRLAREAEDANGSTRERVAREPSPPIASDENVTALASARGSKKD